jgi:hypothetical protein
MTGSTDQNTLFNFTLHTSFFQVIYIDHSQTNYLVIFLGDGVTPQSPKATQNDSGVNRL